MILLRIFCVVAALMLGPMAMGLAQPQSASQPPEGHDRALEAVRNLQAVLGNSNGGGICPPRDHAIAHKVIELHTQLMVTSVACADIYGEPDLHAQYRVFTAAHADRIRDSQQRIQRLLGDADSVEALDHYLSDMANSEALVIQQRSLALYCAMRNSRFHSLIDATPDSFGAYARDVTLRERVRLGC